MCPSDAKSGHSAEGIVDQYFRVIWNSPGGLQVKTKSRLARASQKQVDSTWKKESSTVLVCGTP